jgi:hypothetical protein
VTIGPETVHDGMRDALIGHQVHAEAVVNG